MKKLFLFASVLTISLTSAKTIKTSNSKHTSSLKVKAKKKVAECNRFNYFSTCGISATTCQEGWSVQQGAHWAALIEQNYC